jgi:hypothetical protein
MSLTKKRNSTKIKRNYWKEEEENLLKQWSDKAQCYQWMHNRSRQIYQRKNALYTIPVIIISTLTGTANFAQDRFSDSIKEYVVMTIGSLSIIAGIITTIFQFLKISEINEGHRVALLSWGKFHRNLQSELTRHPLDRTEASILIKMSQEEYDRLVEISPFIPEKVLKEFNNKFKKTQDLIKPEIGNVINSTGVYIMNKDEREKMINEINQSTISTNNQLVQKQKKQASKVEKFKNSFYSLNNRYPTKEEINKNMKFINEANYSSDESSNNSIDLEIGIKSDPLSNENLKVFENSESMRHNSLEQGHFIEENEFEAVEDIELNRECREETITLNLGDTVETNDSIETNGSNETNDSIETNGSNETNDSGSIESGV